MKKTTLILLLTVIFSSLIFANDNSFHLNKNRTEKQEFRKQREEFMRELRKAPAEINPFVIEQEVRNSKYTLRNQKISEQIKEYGKIDERLLFTVYVGNGRLRGDWHERGSNNQAGRIHTADYDSETDMVYLASSGGNVWTGKVDGKSWKCLNNSIQFDNIVNIRYIKQNGKVRIIAFAEKDVWYTDNNGLSWNTANGLKEIKNWGVIKVGAVTAISNDVFVETEEWNYQLSKSKFVIYHSSDKGENFTKISEFNQRNVRIATPRYNDNSLFLIADNIVFKLNNNKEFEKVGENNYIDEEFKFNFNYTFRVSNIKNVNHLAVSFYYDGNAHVTYSDNNGVDWNYQGSAENSFFMNNSFEIGAINPSKMYIGGVDCSFSDNGGSLWTDVNKWYDYYGDPENKLHADIPGIHSFIDGKGQEFFLICTDGGIYTANGTQVKNISLEGLNVSQYYSVCTGKNSIFAGAQDQGLQASMNIGEGILDFRQVYSGDYGHLSTTNNGDMVWMVYPGFSLLFNTVKNELKSLTFGGDYGNRVWLPPIVALPDAPNKAIVAPGGSKSNSTIWELEYDGQNVIGKELDFVFDKDDAASDVSALAISKINHDLYFAGTKTGKFYRSNDKGITWQSAVGFTGPNDHYLYGNAILPSEKDTNNVYFAGSGYSNSAMFFSNDGGKTFKAVGEGLPPCTIFEIAQSEDEDFIFAATTVGPYVYIKTTGKWYDLMSWDSPDQVYWTVEYIKNEKTARFGTYGRGIWDLKIEHLNHLKNDNNQTQKINIKVSPNPISSNMSIDVNTNISGNCVIKLFDIQGNLIDELYNNYIENNIKFDINLNKLPKIAKGNYFITASINGNVGFTNIIVE